MSGPAAHKTTSLIPCAPTTSILAPTEDEAWARAERIAQMPERPFYWLAAESAEKFDTLAGSEFRLAPGARRWDAPETANFFNMCALECRSSR